MTYVNFRVVSIRKLTVLSTLLSGQDSNLCKPAVTDHLPVDCVQPIFQSPDNVLIQEYKDIKNN